MGRILRPQGVVSGFHAAAPDAAVPELIHAGEKWVTPEFMVPWRKHKKWEFYYQVDGSTQWHSSKEKYQVEAGHLIVAPPEVSHAQVNSSGCRHHYFYAQIDLEKVWERIPQLESIFESGRLAHCSHAEALVPPFRQLIREVAFGLPFRDNALRLAVDCLVIEVARVLTHAPNNSALSGHPAVMRAKDLMDQKPRENWPVPTLARMVGLSASRLNESFRNELGLSPHQYLLRLRVDQAAQALTQTDRAITDIALDFGFASSQHFAQVFRKYFGVSARDYRKQEANVKPVNRLKKKSRSRV
jgi:AraC-like DNA-binding protein/mannose-6-phosphate isomerase-like protein (cupin superfamily)